MKKPEQTTKQPVNYPPEIEREINRYGRIKKGCTILYFAGAISIMASQLFLQEYEPPEIIKTHQDAQTSLRTLQNTKKDLVGKILNAPYLNQEIEEAKEMFNRNFGAKISKLHKAIESVEEDILEMESNPKFKQAKQNENTRGRKQSISLYGGMLGAMIGVIGGMHASEKKREH